MRYQVRVDGVRGLTYGIFSGDQSEARPGTVVIDDTITPKRFIVSEKQVTDVPAGYPTVLDKFVDAEFEKARKYSLSLGEGVKAGKLFSVPAADGQAWYVVTRVNKASVTVEWRGFCPDRWVDQVLGCEGTFKKEIIARLVGFADWKAKNFKKVGVAS